MITYCSGSPTQTRRRFQAAWVPVCLFLLGLGVFSSVSHAEDVDTQSKVTAAFVYNFCKFVDWPEPPEDEMVIGVVGPRKTFQAFQGMVGKLVGNTPIAVREVSDLDNVSELDVLFVSGESNVDGSLVEAKLSGRPILTISDIEGFCQQDGHIELTPVRGKLRFSVNKRRADGCGLSVSSQLLKMARKVWE